MSVSSPRALCWRLLDDGALAKRLDVNGRPAWGLRLKRALWRGVAVDIFSVIEPAQWGVIYTIRTGPAEFSRRLVTSTLHGGLLPPHLRVRDGALWHRGDALFDAMMIPTAEETDLFEAVGLTWIPPEARW